jgi:hypothetical protein
VQNLLGPVKISITVFLPVNIIFAPINGVQICAAVAIVKSGDYLRKNFPNKIFANLFVRFDALANHSLQVTSPAELHYNVNLKGFFVDEVVVVLHNAWVLQVAQNIHFSYDLLLFFFIHSTIAKLFPN